MNADAACACALASTLWRPTDAREVPEEHLVVGRIRLHARPRQRAVAQRVVRLEERVAEQDVLVVLVAEHAVQRRDEALRARQVLQ